MSWFRSTLLTLGLVVITPVFGLIAILVRPLPARRRYRIVTVWTRIALWLIRHVTGIDWEVRGVENIPQIASVVFCKHQSGWETLALQAIFPPVSFVLKKELLRIPFFGWGLASLPNIAIDRAAGRDALLQVIDQGRARLAEGFWVVVFPEGTRVAPGRRGRYKIGGAQLAHAAGVPLVPVAHNAGEFWPRNSFLKRPGRVVVSIGPPCYPDGLDPETLSRRAEDWIEGEMRRLFPHHYAQERNR